MKKTAILLFCAAFLLSFCSKKPEPVILIVPDKCQIEAGKEFSISLEGSNMPASGEITWSATKGTLTPPTGVSVIYTAPQETGSVIITAVLEAEGVKYSKTLLCDVVATNLTLETAVAVTGTPTLASADTGNGIAITEVMAAPCDAIRGPSKNEYIELYNYGHTAIDVNGWWIATQQGGAGTPDKISNWDDVNPGVSLGNNVITNSSIIPPNRFAVLLSPLYYTGAGQTLMPYIFPKDTIILTLSNSDYLGNDSTGLLGNTTPLSIIVLYIGSDSVMDTVISSYGTPTFGSSPQNIVDDTPDNFPFPVADCHSVERIVASSRDVISNWRELNSGAPGTGNYAQ